MNHLSEVELVFLGQHGLSADDVFDWRGVNRHKARAIMKSSGKVLALGAACNEAGHRLRTRAGHCVQCDPAKISYQSRKTSRATLYAAESRDEGVFKIGISQDPTKRIGALKKEKYGGMSDWTLVMARELRNAGQSESGIHQSLHAYSVTGEYYKGDHLQSAKEIFRCSLENVKKAFLANISRDQLVENGFRAAPE